MKQLDEYNETLEELADDLLPEANGEPLTEEELLSDDTFDRIFSIEDNHRRTRLLNACLIRAKELNCKGRFDATLRSYIKSLNAVGSASKWSRFPPGCLTINAGTWCCDENGVYQKRVTNEGHDAYEYASTIPILPTALMKNVETGNEKIELSFYKNGKWESSIFDRSVTASAAKIVQTADQGTEATSEHAHLLVKYLSEVVKSNAGSIPFKTSVSHMGWHGEEFIPYTKGVLFDGELEYKPIFDAIKTNGDFNEWKDYTRKLRENIYLRLMMGASFASVLLSKIGALPFILHLWGGTEAGKTVGLMAAMSIWGDPSMGKMVRTMNMTLNSTMTTAATLCDFPFAGDELQIIRERGGNYDTLIMSITEGLERGRMSYDKVNVMKQWHCAFLFTGEEPLTRSSSGGGAKNRVIEIECKDKVIENGKETANFMRKHYGHPGRAFIEYIKDIDLASSYTSFVTALEGIDCTDKQRLSMAAIMLGDALGSMCLFPGEKKLTVSDVQPFLKTRSEVDVSERAFEYIKDVISANDSKFRPNQYGDMRGETWGEFRTATIAKDDKYNEIITYVYINKTILSGLMQDGGYDFEALKSKWLSNMKLFLNTQKRYIHNTRCNGIKGNYIKLELFRELVKAPPKTENVRQQAKC